MISVSKIDNGGMTMVECEQCGNEPIEEDVYCRQCGAELPNSTMNCECGADVLSDDNYCHQCGAAFDGVVEEPAHEEEEGDEESDEDTEDLHVDCARY
jgi:uncharacterized membrane protein YvbJ